MEGDKKKDNLMEVRVGGWQGAGTTGCTVTYTVPQPGEPNYKYNEDKIIAEFAKYIKSTYSAHYIGDDNIQCFDAWIALGSAFTSARDVALKYLWRVKKKGDNKSFRNDLMKILHYTIFMIYNLDREPRDA